MALEWRKHPVLKPPSEAEMAQMDPQKLVELWELYHTAIENAERDPYRYGFVLDNWKKADELLGEFNEILVSGGNRCLASEQEVYDPVKKKALRVDSITEDFHVEAWDEPMQRFVVAKALRPYQKPAAQLIRFSLANGQTLSCSEQHLVLTPLGWREAGSLVAGSYICGPLHNPSGLPQRECEQDLAESTSDIFHQEFSLDGERLNQTTLSSQSDYPAYHHSCGEQLQSEADIVQAISPSQGDALVCISPCDSNAHLTLSDEPHSPSRTLGGLDKRHGYIHYYPLDVRHSIQDALRQRGDQFADILSRDACIPCKSALRLCEDQLLEPTYQQSSAGSGQRQSCRESHQSGNLCGRFSYGDNSITWIRIVNACFLRRDAVWDFCVPGYQNYVAGGVISHNSSKTSYAAKAVVKAAIENHGSIIMCFSQNADVSIRQQQSAIYDALPEELKRRTLGTEENVSYTRKNGFSKGSLILPESHSHIIFKTYAQFLNNDTILEGAELGSRVPRWINIGAWCDEYLIGPELLNTLRFRLATRNSKLIVTFTPIDGYTEVVLSLINIRRSRRRGECL